MILSLSIFTILVPIINCIYLYFLENILKVSPMNDLVQYCTIQLVLCVIEAILNIYCIFLHKKNMFNLEVGVRVLTIILSFYYIILLTIIVFFSGKILNTVFNIIIFIITISNLLIYAYDFYSFLNVADIKSLLYTKGDVRVLLSSTKLSQNTCSGRVRCSSDGSTGSTCSVCVNVCDNTFCATKETECSICLESLYMFNEYVALECDHTFHIECIVKVDSNICPICRKVLTPVKI